MNLEILDVGVNPWHLKKSREGNHYLTGSFINKYVLAIKHDGETIYRLGKDGNELMN
ncbi:hypothetical protein GCM10020219_054480 [Nonomuraea dietziae]